MSTVTGTVSDQVDVGCDALHEKIYNTCLNYLNTDDSRFIAEKIVLAEKMGVTSHGLHYFLYALLPMLKDGNINRPVITEDVQFSWRGPAVVHAEGTGGVGFMGLRDCLEIASHIACRRGIGMVCIKNPGKVGALRVFCQEYMDKGQVIILTKNTARTMGINGPVLGTNPLCIGLPGTKFIYDSSMSTVATNKLRLMRGARFPKQVGIYKGKRTDSPDEILSKDGYLLPFSNNFWYKSFFLGFAIEGLAAMAGGMTGERVGHHKGSRFYSMEGMICIVIDAYTFKHYNSYLKEMACLIKEVGMRLPGEYEEADTCRVSAHNWQEIGGTV